MPSAPSFDAFEFAGFLSARWRLLAGACATAAVLAGGISLVLPKQYTATANILIDTPAGNDPRTATALSPIYLESLKTYERFATSDTLFLRAIEKFRLRDEAGPMAAESLKRRVVKVNKPRDTKLLEISVTLTEAAKAQAVAQYLAEETASLSRALSRQSDEEFAAEARRQAETARARWEETEKVASEETRRQPLELLASEFNDLLGLRARQERELADAEADAAEFPAEAGKPGGARARRDTVQRQLAEVRKSVETVGAALAQRSAFWDRLNAERRAARSAYDAATTRWQEVKAAAGIRGERLKIIDPGIVPQRSSSPNVLLSVFAAALIAFAGAILYLAFAFSYSIHRGVR